MMSENWGYRCLTCDADADVRWNHGDDELRAILARWPVIKPVWDLAQQGVIWSLEVRSIRDGNPLEFLAEHDGHTVVVQSEYGTTKEPPS